MKLDQKKAIVKKPINEPISTPNKRHPLRDHAIFGTHPPAPVKPDIPKIITPIFHSKKFIENKTINEPPKKHYPLKPPFRINKPLHDTKLSPLVQPTQQSTQPIDGPVKRALLIGINYYGTNNELRGCIDDVNIVNTLLMQLDYTEITLLIDNPADSNFNNNNSPTKGRILSKISELVEKTKKGDTLFIQYSGHGSTVPDAKKNDKQDEEIYSVDSKFITDDELNTILIKPFPNGAKLRAVFDSCFSGSILDLPIRYDENNHIDSENTEITTKDIIMISGSSDTQTSADAYINGQFNGALTWAFINAINNLSIYNLSKWTWKDLIYKIRYLLISNGFKQKPQLDSSNIQEMSNTIFI